jgi:hypothetical protein
MKAFTIAVALLGAGVLGMLAQAQYMVTATHLRQEALEADIADLRADVDDNRTMILSLFDHLGIGYQREFPAPD